MVSIKELRQKYFGALDATDEDMQIVSAVREYVDKEIMPRRQDLDGGWHRDETLARETFATVHKGLVDIGVQRGVYPEELGGLGISPVANEMIVEEISRADAGLATHLGIINWVMRPAMSAGRMDLLQQYVPKICDDSPHTCCMALTEPSGGANSEDPTQHGRTLQTVAELDGDEWVINGHKIWPSGGGLADIAYCTLCTTDPAKGDEGVALIYVPPGAEGMTFSKPFQKMGMCWTDTNTEVFFDNVRVPKENRVAGPGKDAEILHDIVATGRLATCSFALGAAQACFEIALNWTKDREIAGKKVRSRSLHAGILGEMAMKIECARAYKMHINRMLRSGKYGRPGSRLMLSKCSAAKVHTCDMTIWVVNKAMELMGSYGYAFDYNVEKYYRDVKILQLWIGGSQRAILDAALGYYAFEW